MDQVGRVGRIGTWRKTVSIRIPQGDGAGSILDAALSVDEPMGNNYYELADEVGYKCYMRRKLRSKDFVDANRKMLKLRGWKKGFEKRLTWHYEESLVPPRLRSRQVPWRGRGRLSSTESPESNVCHRTQPSYRSRDGVGIFEDRTGR